MEKMKLQNAKLKKEFAELKQKLEECIEKAKRGTKANASDKPAQSEEELSIYSCIKIFNSSRTRDKRNRAESCVL